MATLCLAIQSPDLRASGPECAGHRLRLLWLQSAQCPDLLVHELQNFSISNYCPC